jgi:hypothetical protein
VGSVKRDEQKSLTNRGNFIREIACFGTGECFIIHIDFFPPRTKPVLFVVRRTESIWKGPEKAAGKIDVSFRTHERMRENKRSSVREELRKEIAHGKNL